MVDGLEVGLELRRVSQVARFGVDQPLEFLNRKGLVALPLHAANLVLRARGHGEVEGDYGGVGGFADHFYRGVGNFGFEIAAGEIDGKEFAGCVVGDVGAQVVFAFEVRGGSVQGLEFGRGSPGEVGFPDCKAHAGGAEADGVDGAARFPGVAHVVGAGINATLDEQGLQDFGNVVCEGTADGDFAAE